MSAGLRLVEVQVCQMELLVQAGQTGVVVAENISNTFISDCNEMSGS